MPGPVPKLAALRQRRNRTSAASKLPAGDGRRVRSPQLPAAAGRDWHPLTRAWWTDLWTSPMQGEYLQADLHGLYILADLVDRYWSAPSISMAQEIRQHRLAFGLSPIDRRRLQWEVERGEDRKNRRATRERKPSSFAQDPRENLRTVI